MKQRILSNFPSRSKFVWLLAMGCVLFGFRPSETTPNPAGDVSFSVVVTPQAYVVSVNGKPIQKVKNNGQLLSLVRDPLAGKVVLEPIKTSLSPEKYFGSRIRKVDGTQGGKLTVEGRVEADGAVKMVVKDSPTTQDMTIAPSDCKLLEFGKSGDLLLFSETPKSIKIEFEGDKMRLSRQDEEGEPVLYSLPENDNKAFFGTCDLGAPDQAHLVDGGMGVVIVLDGIVDPDLRRAGSGLDAATAKYLQKSWNLLLVSYSETVPCKEMETKSWTKMPVACNSLEAAQIAIHCNRYMEIQTEKGPVVVDLVSCGAKLVVRDGKVMVYAGCLGMPSLGC